MGTLIQSEALNKNYKLDLDVRVHFSLLCFGLSIQVKSWMQKYVYQNIYQPNETQMIISQRLF